jgi:NitT/TauT family transport system ATP-binding protein
MIPVRIGFLPLCDAALIVAVVEGDFGAREGLAITPVREVSWANIRDKLNIGLLDAAHMLAPLAIASSLGLAQVRAPMVVPFTLNLNGNAITLSTALADAMGLGDRPLPPAESAGRLAVVVAQRMRAGLAPLTFGMTFPFSMHHYQLRRWMALGGVDPDVDVRLVVLPPPFMAEHLRSGFIDGFCVGAPWNAVAVDEGLGTIAVAGVTLQPDMPEKVLACTAQAHARAPETTAALVRAFQAAADDLARPGGLAEIARLLAQPRYLDLPENTIRRTLDGDLRRSLAAPIAREADYLRLAGPGVNRPDTRQADQVIGELVAAGQMGRDAGILDQARAVFRADLYDRALAAGVEA